MFCLTRWPVRKALLRRLAVSQKKVGSVASGDFRPIDTTEPQQRYRHSFPPSSGIRKGIRNNIIFHRQLAFYGTTTNEDDAPRSFQEMDDLSPELRAVLTDNGFGQRTEVQAKTWPAAVAGHDVLSRSRTGTGKTLAVLLPSLQRIKPSQGKISILVLSPTRELAQQIGGVASMFQTVGVRSQVMVGGFPKQQDIERMQQQIPTILTATPGRLRDHLGADTSTPSFVGQQSFGNFLDELQVLILDEVDRLLEMGFRGEIQDIVSLLPSERQTLVVSATIPKHVQHLLIDDRLIKPNFTAVDCIADATLIEEEDSDEHPWTSTTAVAGEEVSVDHKSIEQSFVMLPSDRLIAGVAQILLQLMANPHHKIVVFFPTTSQVAYFNSLFQLALGRRVMSLHSKKNQNARSVTSELFREANQGVLFTSDVSARGVDYPDVTHVVQIGVAADRDTYIHRLGRTGRAGKSGKGLLVLLMDEERIFLERELGDFDIPEDEKLQKLLQKPLGTELEMNMMKAAKEMRSGENPELLENAEAVYRSLLGYYHTRLKGLTPKTGTSLSRRSLVETVNSLAAQSGLQELPTVSEALAKQVGTKGLNVRSQWSIGQGFDVGQRKGRVESSAERFLPPTKQSSE